MPQTKLQQRKQGSGLGGEGHDLGPCNCLQGLSQNTGVMGNREYVVEKWPYPNVPVYEVCPRDGEGCSQTLHRNYLPPISSNIEQNEDTPVAGIEHTNTSTPVPPADTVAC